MMLTADHDREGPEANGTSDLQKLLRAVIGYHLQSPLRSTALRQTPSFSSWKLSLYFGVTGSEYEVCTDLKGCFASVQNISIQINALFCILVSKSNIPATKWKKTGLAVHHKDLRDCTAAKWLRSNGRFRAEVFYER